MDFLKKRNYFQPTFLCQQVSLISVKVSACFFFPFHTLFFFFQATYLFIFNLSTIPSFFFPSFLSPVSKDTQSSEIASREERKHGRQFGRLIWGISIQLNALWVQGELKHKHWGLKAIFELKRLPLASYTVMLPLLQPILHRKTSHQQIYNVQTEPTNNSTP